MLSKSKILTKNGLIIGSLVILLVAIVCLTGGGISYAFSNFKHTGATPDDFLKQYNLKVKGNPNKFNVHIPKTWDVKLGDYPVGLYWRMANEFSKDVGLDLTPLKNTNVEVWKYSLAEGLPGQQQQSNFNYPSDVILLVDRQKVVGAWLTFNKWTIGPSVKKRYLTDITGLTFEEWADKEAIFANAGKNNDLSKLQPTELLKAYYKAINDGDKGRAYACFGATYMLNSLTQNLKETTLYNKGYNKYNSCIEYISKVTPISISAMNFNNFSSEQKADPSKEVEFRVVADFKYNNSPTYEADGKHDEYIILRKYENGWKIQSIGTGP